MITSKNSRRAVLVKYSILFILLNIVLYVFISLFGARIPLNTLGYKVAYHFYTDERIQGRKTDLFKSLAVFDAQWYLRIAQTGYPKIKGTVSLDALNIDDAPSYAFFPLYPLTITLINSVMHNATISAFVLANIILMINFFLLILLISRLDNFNTGVKTAFLLFSFPLSIFFRSYFSEGVFLTFLLLFSYSLLKKKYIISSFFFGLLTVIKANSIPLFFLILYQYFFSERKIRMHSKIITFALIVLISIAPILLWSLFCFFNTGNPLVYLKVREYWFANSYTMPLKFFVPYMLNNAYSIIEFPFLAWHSFSSSKVEVIAIFAIFTLLIKSRKTIPPMVWGISLLLWLFPLITTTTMSFSRYQIVSYPLFYFLAKKLSGWKYYFCLFIFISTLFVLSIYFVNWYWLG